MGSEEPGQGSEELRVESEEQACGDADGWDDNLTWKDARWLVLVAVLVFLPIDGFVRGLPWWGQIGVFVLVSLAMMYYEVLRQWRACPTEERGSLWQPLPPLLLMAAILGMLFWLLYSLVSWFFGRYTWILGVVFVVMQLSILVFGLRHIVSRRRAERG